MTIHLPSDLESSIQSAVLSGQFASVDDAMAEAARLLIRELKNGSSALLIQVDEQPDSFLGSMADHAELMDQIVEDAMRHREHQPWRLTAGE
jgi:Arc/MetJ-type ribon-helix-helix transcriptional regulator